MSMPISQLQLEAFYEVARQRHFTKAAKTLHVTQSALSHRIRNLEEELETSLFVRLSSGVSLTEAGTRLLQYCRIQNQAETECVREIRSPKNRGGQLGGILRIGGTSSLMRSVFLPSLGELLRSNPDIQLHFLVRETHELPALLHSGTVDFAITSGRMLSAGLEETLLGREHLVEVASKQRQSPVNVFLDHDPEDQTTIEFLKLHARKREYIRRSYFDDIYGVMDGVAEGLGRAVVPLHLARRDSRLKIVSKRDPIQVPVYFYRARQPYTTRLHAEVIAVVTAAAKRLEG